MDVELWIFIGALTAAYLIPGPDMILILEMGASSGRRRGFATAAGLAIARALHVALAALGLAALFRTAPWTFDIVRLLGAAYLIWLGIQILRSRADLPDAGTAGGPRAVVSCRTAIRRGLLTNLLNPKALLFCSVLLPQFVRPEQGSVFAQFALLGVVLVATGMAFDSLYAVTGEKLACLVGRSAMIRRLQRWTFGTLLIGFGGRLAALQ